MSGLLNKELYDLASLQQEEMLDGRLERALNYRKVLYPLIEANLDPQSQDSKAIKLQVELDQAFNSGQKNTVKNLYLSKRKKAMVIESFIDEVLNDPIAFGVSFDSPPSVNDKLWTKAILVHDLLYYGPVTILTLERILKEGEEIASNPLHQILKEASFGEEITEVRVNNHKDIYYEAGNHILKWKIPFISEKQLFSIIERMISESNILNNSSININGSSPIADFEHPCGYIRGAAMIPPASEAPFVTLRVHPQNPYTLDQLINFGMLSKEMGDFLVTCQKAGCTMAIAGTMGSGKTTLLSALSEYWPNNGRKATIEDTPELRPRISDLIKMRTIDYERDDLLNIDVARLTKACKRHSVRYVVLSEARDASAWEILQLSQAILGTLMTFHYTLRGTKFLVDQALNTLVALCKQHHLAPSDEDVKHQIASMVQILILIEQDPVDNIRRVTNIYYITGYDEMNGGHFKSVEMYRYAKDAAKPTFVKANNCPEFEEYLKIKGVELKEFIG